MIEDLEQILQTTDENEVDMEEDSSDQRFQISTNNATVKAITEA